MQKFPCAKQMSLASCFSFLNSPLRNILIISHVDFLALESIDRLSSINDPSSFRIFSYNKNHYANSFTR